MKLKIVTTILAVLFLYQNIIAQEFGISLGVMRNYSPKESSNSNYSFYPEISLSNNFFSQNINWQLAFGYLNDGLEPDERGSIGNYYSSKDYILSTRLVVNLSKVLNNQYVPGLITGISFHFVDLEYVDPLGPVPLHFIPDENETRLYFDIGAKYKVAEVWGISIEPRYMALIPLSNSAFLHNKIKHSFVLSFKY